MSPRPDDDAIVVDEGHETLAAAAAALVEAAERSPLPEVWEDVLGGEPLPEPPRDDDGLVHSALAELRALAGSDDDDELEPDAAS